MTTILLTTTLILANLFNLFGQSNENKIYLGQVVADSTTIKIEDGIVKTMNQHFSPIINSNNKIEIRIAKAYLPSFSVKISYNNSWNFEKFTYDSKNRIYDTIKVVNQAKLKKLVENLVKKNVFSLPGNETQNFEKFYLDVDKNEILGEGIGISHPNYYCLEFKVGEMYRRYYYYEQEKIYSFLKVAEVENFIEIIEFINKVK